MVTNENLKLYEITYNIHVHLNIKRLFQILNKYISRSFIPFFIG